MDAGSAGMFPSAAYEIFLCTNSSSALVLLPSSPFFLAGHPSPSLTAPWEGKRGRDELSLGSHLALSCYFWGGAFSPLLDSGKCMGETLGRWENMASPGTRGKLVGAVLVEAEYINIYRSVTRLSGRYCEHDQLMRHDGSSHL